MPHQNSVYATVLDYTDLRSNTYYYGCRIRVPTSTPDETLALLRTLALEYVTLEYCYIGSDVALYDEQKQQRPSVKKGFASWVSKH